MKDMRVKQREIYWYTCTKWFLGTKWRGFESISFAVASFVQISSICLFQDNTSSISIPEYLMWECNFNLWLFALMPGSRSKWFRGDLHMMSSVLVSFKDYLLFRDHWTKSFNSWLMTDLIVPSFLARSKRLVSSTKWWRTYFEKALCRSFI